jgi:hypothetical protein
MRLLHLSDVHFHGADHGWDEDEDQRGQILLDVRVEVAANGPFDALLFGGDIAFSALPAEYQLATRWLDELIEAGGLEGRHRVFTVPGNHDVNRQVINASQALQDFRRAVDASDENEIDDTLRRRMSSDPAAPSVFAHLDAYNDFAEQFLCGVTPARPAWSISDFELDGWRVRLVGLTSVINCGPNDESASEGEQSLVLGTQQCRMSRGENDITLVMMHHPPKWIRDWSRVKPHLSRAHLWLFGHEHAFGAQQAVELGTVEVRAGAVAPERRTDEAPDEFLPAFNFITLARQDEQLMVSVKARLWSNDLTRFVQREQLDFAIARDLLPETPVQTQIKSKDHDDSMSASPLSLSDSPDDSKIGENVLDLRKVAIEFMSLPTNRRNEIARSLGVVGDQDFATSPTYLYPTVLRRIAEQQLINQLVKEMAA